MSLKDAIDNRKEELDQVRQPKGKKTWIIFLALLALLVVIISLPPVWSRVDYHSRVVYRTIKYWIKPPNEAVFVPSTSNNNSSIDPSSAALPTVDHTATPTPQPTTIPTSLPTTLVLQATPESTLPPTPTTAPSPTPLPSSILLTGFHPERQFMNNCGPATLSMNLSYYDWGKDQIAAGAVLRPNDVDVNVMPYELVDFVNENTDLKAIWRYGGDLQTIKILLNAGFPVMIEKSFEPYSLRNEGWVGHYNLVVGYEDSRQTLTVHDSYFMSYPPWGGEIPYETWDTFIGFDFSYTELEEAWRAFNFVFLVVYPPEKEGEVLNALGPLASAEDATRIAYDRAIQETTSLTGERDRFFAWFNVGTSLVAMQEYSAAADAYDTAYSIYPGIEKEARPYRILWYETNIYPAYYYSERYQDVINLASQTLGYMAEPVLEESFYWRAMAYNAIGDTKTAIADLRSSLKFHPGYKPSLEMLNQMGLLP